MRKYKEKCKEIIKKTDVTNMSFRMLQSYINRNMSKTQSLTHGQLRQLLRSYPEKRTQLVKQTFKVLEA